jgi:hypothetical protein
LVNKHFGPPLTDSPIGELALLRRDGSIDDFAKRFMALSCRDTAITESHQDQLFIAGLGKPLRTDVALQRPLTLCDTVMLARAYEQHDSTPASAPPPPPSRAAAHSFTKPSTTNQPAQN